MKERFSYMHAWTHNWKCWEWKVNRTKTNGNDDDDATNDVDVDNGIAWGKITFFSLAVHMSKWWGKK